MGRWRTCWLGARYRFRVNVRLPAAACAIDKLLPLACHSAALAALGSSFTRFELHPLESHLRRRPAAAQRVVRRVVGGAGERELKLQNRVRKGFRPW